MRKSINNYSRFTLVTTLAETNVTSYKINTQSLGNRANRISNKDQ